MAEAVTNFTASVYDLYICFTLQACIMHLQAAAYAVHTTILSCSHHALLFWGVTVDLETAEGYRPSFSVWQAVRGPVKTFVHMCYFVHYNWEV